MRVSERYTLNNYNVSRIARNRLIENQLHSYMSFVFFRTSRLFLFFHGSQLLICILFRSIRSPQKDFQLKRKEKQKLNQY